MRVPLLALLALFVLGVAHAQLHLGPHGVSSPPINVVTVYKFMRDLWYRVSGTGGLKSSDSVRMASKQQAETRSAGRSDSDKDYDDDLKNIKSVILAANEAEALKTRTDTPEGPKRNRGTKLNGEKISTESPLTRAILLPKKKIVLGKWPIVYGVLNGLLLAAAIILAKPYFFTGETIVSKYEKDKEEKKKGGMYGKYSGEDMEEMAYAMPLPMTPSYGMPGTAMPYGPPADLAEGQLSPMYSTHMMVVRDDLDEKPKLKYKLKGGMFDDSKLSSHFKLKGKSSEVMEVSMLPPPAPPQRLPPPPSQPLPQYQSSYGQPSYAHPSPTGSKGVSKERKEDVPLNELHYYNPTVFVSDEPSSYACLERMVCMNPSRRGQVAEAKVAEAKSLSGEHVPNPAELNFMIRRLDQAAAYGANHGDCSQYFCPPQLPTLNQEQIGDQYSPPPAADRFSFDGTNGDQYAPPVGNQISPQLAANHFSLGPGNLNPQSANEVQFSPQEVFGQHSQSAVGDNSRSKETNKDDVFSIQKLQPIYQNENVQGNVPSIITAHHVLQGQLRPSPKFGNGIHRTQQVEEDDVSEKVASTPAPVPKGTTPIRWIQAPRIQASNIRAPDYGRVAVETTETEEEAAYRQHPKNFLRRSSQPVASVIAVPVPGREVKTTIIEPNRTGKSESEPET